MNHTSIIKHFALGALVMTGACGEIGSPTGDDDAGSFQLVVAPWESDSQAQSACYDIEVRGADAKVVWSKDTICTDEFGIGDNGTLNYVSVCDASGGPNTVSISLVSLLDADGEEIGHYGDHPPTFTDTFECTRNQDTVVRATFLVITEGDKGFVDIQVTVQTIECNAKIDCQPDFFESTANAEDCDCDITDPACLELQDACALNTGTIVVALACEAQGSGFAHLMLDDVTLTCGRRNGRLGTHTVHVASATGLHAGYPNMFVGGAIGNAGVTTDGTSFWTLAIAVEEGYSNCHLSTRMAVSDGRDMDDNDQFPIIVASAIPFGFDEAGLFSCETQPLNGEGSCLSSTWGSGGELDFDSCLKLDGTIDVCLDI